MKNTIKLSVAFASTIAIAACGGAVIVTHLMIQRAHKLVAR